MRSLQSGAVGLKLGLVVTTAVAALLSWRYPAFFSEGPGQKIGFVVALVRPRPRSPYSAGARRA